MAIVWKADNLQVVKDTVFKGQITLEHPSLEQAFIHNSMYI